MSISRQKIFLWLVAAVALGLTAAAIWAGWFYVQMRRSLPQLEGAATLPALTGSVTIQRDALGVPTISGANRLDVARALGWLHAQERYFQMDLLRRRASGELAAMFGPKALAADKAARIHDFRRIARENINRLNPDERALIEAYATGVNAGLTALAQVPPEYVFLRTPPEPWRPEDTGLVAFAMAMELSDEGAYERSLTALRNTYGTGAADFFAPLLTPADAALDGSLPLTLAPLPSARLINLRTVESQTASSLDANDELPHGGSNSFALGGAHTANGGALLASDMHLHLRVPNIWYRATLAWPDHKITGVTLPGIPLVIAGSNGRVAWGMTNAYADTSDIVVVEPSVIARTLYKKGDQLVPFETRHEIIEVKGGDPVDLAVDWTEWGPVIGAGDKTRPLVLHWTAHQPGAINLALVGMEDAHTTDEAIAVAHRAGMPAQNILIVDQKGHIAWTIAGGLPKRAGYDGRYPVAWTYGDRYWDGMVPDNEVPVLKDPESGRLWTANNRILGEPALSILGDGGYDRPQRAARIRDRLAGLENATPADLLAIQLDDRAPMLDQWRQLLLDTLTPEAVAANKSRAELRRQLADWDARARIDSVSYRLVRLFRQQTASLVFSPIFAPCVAEYADFTWHRFHYEQPLWTILHERPLHLLSARFQNWNELLLAAADDVSTQLRAKDLAVDEATWGQRNRAQIKHPLARVLPAWLSGWLNMPADPLPGDSITPRVQRPDFGASERFVVSPGREAEGIFHMPGGQSGHPLSPFYRAGHDAWVAGQPTPFLPGAPVHTLILEP
jgi:penicillin G amidase